MDSESMQEMSLIENIKGGKRVSIRCNRDRKIPRRLACLSAYHKCSNSYIKANGHGLTMTQAKERTKSMGACQICGSDQLLVVDHDHETGEIRGVLCRSCNAHLGWYERYSTQMNDYLHSSKTMREVRGKL